VHGQLIGCCRAVAVGDGWLLPQQQALVGHFCWPFLFIRGSPFSATYVLVEDLFTGSLKPRTQH
jgi:hypothetical protein